MCLCVCLCVGMCICDECVYVVCPYVCLYLCTCVSMCICYMITLVCFSLSSVCDLVCGECLWVFCICVSNVHLREKCMYEICVCI